MDKVIRVGVTGGRDYANRDKANEVMDGLLKSSLTVLVPMFVVVGCCPTGLDLFVREWCDRNLPDNFWKEYKADWPKYGKRAGPIRNSEMANSGLDLLMSFPGGTGTADMTKKCKAKGIRVKEIKV